MKTSIIKIEERDGKQAVNARDLHAFLDSKQRFVDWIKGRIEKYSFIEGEDYQKLCFDYQGNLLSVRGHNFMKSENKHVSKIEYALSISMAKELVVEYGISNYGRWMKANVLEAPYMIKNEDWIPFVIDDDRSLSDDCSSKRTKDHVITTTATKTLCQNDVNIGGARLRERFKDSLPSQCSIENGWLAIAKKTYEHPKRRMQLYRKAMVTPREQKHFVNNFFFKTKIWNKLRFSKMSSSVK